MRGARRDAHAKAKANSRQPTEQAHSTALQLTIPDNDDWYSFCASLLPGNIAELISYYLPAVLSLYRRIWGEVSFLAACESDLPHDRQFFVTSECVSLGGGRGSL